MGLPDRERSLTMSSAVVIQIHQRAREADRRTDRRTPGDSKDREKCTKADGEQFESANVKH